MSTSVDAVAQSQPAATARWYHLTPALGQLAGWTVLAAIDAVLIAVTLPWPKGGLEVRALHYVYDAAELLAFGVLSACAVLLWQLAAARVAWRDARWRRLGALVASFVPALLIGAWMLPADFHGFAGSHAGNAPAWLLRYAMVGTAELAIPLTIVFGRWLGHGWRRAIGIVLAVTVAVLNNAVVAHEYPGVHFFVAWCAAILLGISLTRFDARPKPALGQRVALGTAAVASLWSFVVAPSDTVQLKLFGLSSSVVAPWLAQLEHSTSPNVGAVIPPDQKPWFRDREHAAAIPPHRPSPLPKDGIVLFLVGDAVRQDIISAHYEKSFPNLTRLKRESVEFANARSAAPGTVGSITAVFTGRYPMQIVWGEQFGRPYPTRDRGVRFTQILEKHGVDTVNIQGLPGLARAHGITRGMLEEQIINKGFLGARYQIPALIRRLKRQKDKPFFAYLHFDDAHAPYNSVGRKRTPFLGYLSEIGTIDSMLGRLMDFLDRSGLASRTAIFFAADHGEAFGEHGYHYHGTTAYDELLRVPLLVHVPGITPRRVKEPVSLIDLPSTFLDLFGCSTPGSFMGQSLVPLLSGEHRLSRPIFAQAYFGHNAMVFRDGYKLIVNDQRHTRELFDLRRDPKELRNLFDSRPTIARQRVAILRAFMKAHHKPGHGYR